jgi:hypothetical protein
MPKGCMTAMVEAARHAFVGIPASRIAINAALMAHANAL